MPTHSSPSSPAVPLSTTTAARSGAWRRSRPGATVRVLDVADRDGETVVTTKVDGNFDRTGLPDRVIINHLITVAGDKIVGLTCRLAGGEKRRAESGEQSRRRRSARQALGVGNKCHPQKAAVLTLARARPLRGHPVAAYHSDQLSEHTFMLFAAKVFRRGHKYATLKKAAISAVGATAESGERRVESQRGSVGHSPTSWAPGWVGD